MSRWRNKFVQLLKYTSYETSAFIFVKMAITEYIDLTPHYVLGNEVERGQMSGQIYLSSNVID